jgi:hypothetical protein
MSCLSKLLGLDALRVAIFEYTIAEGLTRLDSVPMPRGTGSIILHPICLEVIDGVNDLLRRGRVISQRPGNVDIPPRSQLTKVIRINIYFLNSNISFLPARMTNKRSKIRTRRHTHVIPTLLSFLLISSMRPLA